MKCELKFHLDDITGDLYVSQDNGCTWEFIGHVTGAGGGQGQQGEKGDMPNITAEAEAEDEGAEISITETPTEEGKNLKFIFRNIKPVIGLQEDLSGWHWVINDEVQDYPSPEGKYITLEPDFTHIGETGQAEAFLSEISRGVYKFTLNNLKGERGREIELHADISEDTGNIVLSWNYVGEEPQQLIEIAQGKDYRGGRLINVTNENNIYKIDSALIAGDNITIDEDTGVIDAIKPVNYTVVSKTDINGLYLYKIQDINGKEYSAINLYDYKNLDGQYLNPYVQDKFIYTYVDNEEYSIIVSIYNDNDDFSGCYFQLSYKEYEGAAEQIYDFFVQRKRQTLLKNDIVNVYTNCKWSINEKIDMPDDKTYRSAYIYINKPINKKGIITITPIVYFNKRPTIVRSFGAMSQYLWYYENNTKQELEKLIGYKCNADTVKADSSGLKIGKSTTSWEDVTDNQIDTLLSNGSISIVNASLENHNSGKIQFFKYKVENDSTYHFTFTDNIYIQLNPIGNDVYDFKTTGEPQTINIASPQKEYEVQNGILEIHNNNFNVFTVDCILDIQGLKLNDKVRDEIIEKAILYNQLINNNLKYKEANDDSVIKYPVKVVIEEMRYIDFTRKQIKDITFLNKTETGSNITNFTIDNVKEGFYSLTIKYQGWKEYSTFSIYVPNFTTPKEVRYMLSNYGTGSESSGTNYRKMYIHKIIDKI